MPDRHTDAAAVPVPDAGGDMLRVLREELADAILDTSHNGLDCGNDPTPIHEVVDALLPRIRAHTERAVEQARADERERVLRWAADKIDPGKYTLTHPFGNSLRVMQLVRDDCARIARGQEIQP